MAKCLLTTEYWACEWLMVGGGGGGGVDERVEKRGAKRAACYQPGW